MDLSRPCRARACLKRAVGVNRPYLEVAQHNHRNNRNQRDAGAKLGEECPVARVESKLSILRNTYFAGQHPLRERAAGVVVQNLSDTSEFIDEASYAGVGRADHRTPRFDTTENRIGQMLL